VNRPYDDDEDGPPGRGYSRDPGRSDSDRTDLGHSADREISLGAPAILGIFFALVLVCAVFFGFGYTMGRKSAQAATADTIAANADTSSNGSAKPAAGSLAGQPAAQPAADSASPVVVQTVPASGSPATQPTPSKNAATAADGMIVGDKPPTSNQPPAISPSGTIMVQIAAVSSQDVADILLTSLRKKGYSVSVRHEPQDKLLHIQIGPFANRKDAEAMQQRVLADGFNAIVK
jgi:cell division septation protein DedD